VPFKKIFLPRHDPVISFPNHPFAASIRYFAERGFSGVGDGMCYLPQRSSKPPKMDKQTGENRLMNVPNANPCMRKQRQSRCTSSRALRLCGGFIFLGSLLAACSGSKEPEEEKPASAGRAEIVGRVASISQGNSFLLIQSYGDWKVADGTILITRGAEERTANLRVTGEKLGQFAAADIQSGDVVVGDVVLLLPARPLRPDSPPEDTENQAPGGSDLP
jgi:hypothetical protein